MSTHALKKPKSILKSWKFWLILIVTIIAALGIAFYSFVGLIDRSASQSNVKATLPSDIAYISEPEIWQGKILAVLTSTDKMGNTDKSTGYELTELARAYYVFQSNGFSVDIASPLGGKAPVVIDNDDMGPFDYAFLNDPIAQSKASNTISLANIDPSEYKAVYFVGGKGTMFDFPNNPHIPNIVQHIYENQGVVGAVCHGPAALINVTLSDGNSLLKGKAVTSFTNSEELFLIPEAESIFPFLLESQLVEMGAIFEKAEDYMQQTSVDGRLVTGQNPWSVWETAGLMLEQLGIDPKHRERTDEEIAIDLLMTYKAEGYQAAKDFLQGTFDKRLPVKRNLVLMHGIVAGMKYELIDAVNLVRLTSAIKEYQEEQSKI